MGEGWSDLEWSHSAGAWDRISVLDQRLRLGHGIKSTRS